MNPRLFPLALAFLACTTPTQADEARWNVTAECQMVTLPQKAALALLPDLLDETKIEAAFAKLQEMIEHAEATLVANLVAKSRDREKGTAESINEVRYVTEYDLPKMPDTPDMLKNWPLVGVTPKAFETRNVGTILEIITRVLAKGSVLGVQVMSQDVRLQKMTHFDAGHLPNGEHIGVDQPEFGSTKNTGSLLLRNSQRVLVGMHKILDEPVDTMEFFILKVSAVPAP